MTSGIALKQFVDGIRSRLSSHFPDGEAGSITRIVAEEMLHRAPVDVILHREEPVSPYMQDKVNVVVDRILADEPVQYIFGKTRFCGLELKVTPAVLIPRPETEQLVDIIVKEWGGRPDLHVLDCCTGSGCIAVALARALLFPVVDAVDISPEALVVARDNADSLNVKVNYGCVDVLSMSPPPEPICNIIVSNPPYVTESERGAMSSNVLDHEPAVALFVPDEDALRFYNAIARYAVKALLPGGKLYFEINPLFSADMLAMLRDTGFSDVELQADMYGKQRFAIALSPSADD